MARASRETREDAHRDTSRRHEREPVILRALVGPYRLTPSHADADHGAESADDDLDSAIGVCAAVIISIPVWALIIPIMHILLQ